MISLSYPSKSARWASSGLFFKNWDEYSVTLGYLCNIDHYRLYGRGVFFIQIEANDLDGAYAKEGRMLFSGDSSWMSSHLSALYRAKAPKDNGNMKRTNCNDYVYSLIKDYSFILRRRGRNVLLDVIPPAFSTPVDSFNHVFSRCPDINRGAFLAGYNL